MVGLVNSLSHQQVHLGGGRPEVAVGEADHEHEHQRDPEAGQRGAKVVVPRVGLEVLLAGGGVDRLVVTVDGGIAALEHQFPPAQRLRGVDEQELRRAVGAEGRPLRDAPLREISGRRADHQHEEGQHGAVSDGDQRVPDVVPRRFEHIVVGTAHGVERVAALGAERRVHQRVTNHADEEQRHHQPGQERQEPEEAVDNLTDQRDPVDDPEQDAAEHHEADEQQRNHRREQVGQVTGLHKAERLANAAPLLAGELHDGHAGDDPAEEAPHHQQPNNDQQQVQVGPEAGPGVEQVIDRGEELQKRFDKVRKLVGEEPTDDVLALGGAAADDRLGEQKRVGPAVFVPGHRAVLAAEAEGEVLVPPGLVRMGFLIPAGVGFGRILVGAIGGSGEFIHQRPGGDVLAVGVFLQLRANFLGRPLGDLAGVVIAELGNRPAVIEDDRDQPPSDRGGEDAGGRDQ